MKPTIYLPLANRGVSGPCRLSASSAARFGAGRSEMRRLWVDAEGGQVGTKDQRTQSAGGSGEKRTP
jgi:hypothetical protein